MNKLRLIGWLFLSILYLNTSYGIDFDDYTSELYAFFKYEKKKENKAEIKQNKVSHESKSPLVLDTNTTSHKQSDDEVNQFMERLETKITVKPDQMQTVTILKNKYFIGGSIATAAIIIGGVTYWFNK